MYVISKVLDITLFTLAREMGLGYVNFMVSNLSSSCSIASGIVCEDY